MRLKHWFRKAAREHICTTCGDPIEKGTHHVQTEEPQQVAFSPGLVPVTVARTHPTCFEMKERGFL